MSVARATLSWTLPVAVALMLGLVGVRCVPALEPAAMTDRSEQLIASRMAALYDAAASDVNAMAARAIREINADPQRRSSQWRETRAATLGRQIEARLAALGVASAGVIAQGRPAINGAIRRGEIELRELYGTASPALGSGAPERVGFGVIDGDAVAAIAEDTEARLAQRVGESLSDAGRRYGRGAVTVFRSLSDSLANVSGSAETAVNEAVARALILGDPVLADRAIRDLYRDPGSPQREGVRRLGNKLIEVGDGVFTVRQYAATVTRTRLREATEAAHRSRITRSGVRLGQIFGSNSANFCTAFVGLAVSLTGSAETIGGVTYRPIESLPGGGPPFHPNCSKNTVAYDADLVRPSRVEQAEAAERVYQRRREAGTLLARVV